MITRHAERKAMPNKKVSYALHLYENDPLIDVIEKYCRKKKINSKATLIRRALANLIGDDSITKAKVGRPREEKG